MPSKSAATFDKERAMQQRHVSDGYMLHARWTCCSADKVACARVYCG